MFGNKSQMVDADRALAGREQQMPVSGRHTVLGSSTVPQGVPGAAAWPEGTQVLYLAFGCFWGAERIMWRQPGVIATAVGYQGGYTPNPSYEEVCSGRTGHAEVVLVAYDPAKTSAEQLLKVFWENHDPTQGMRQGNDVGTQYRSAVYYTTDEQRQAALAARDAFAKVLHDNGYGDPTTEIRAAEDAGPFYYAEDYHQQYLDKNPGGYCMHGPNGMTCPVGIVRQDQVPSQQVVLGQQG
ncbi:peptide-methionine (S)-S-oxide reductase MsrA [Nakamurella aerolata]|nr:peptide-methionine (S)-S-oxide reductase MsrA [Nakamurella aerolata]